MSSDLVSITLSEWETLNPANCPELVGKYFDESAGVRRVIDDVNSRRMMNLTELKDGVSISSYSHVGRIRLGNLNITVLPKINSTSLLRLLRYAFGFRQLKLLSTSTHLSDDLGFQDLLISQLNLESRELISRGLQRSYLSLDEQLASPRGRINVNRLALQGGSIRASLPCQHHPRDEDTFLNQVLMAGLQLAGTLASHIELRRDSRRLASMMEEQVSSINLDASSLDKSARMMTRLTTTYSSSLSIIRLLVESQGIVLENKAITSKLPGFLFDMNTFFQTLLSRLLRENLPNHTVHDEQRLKGMMKYNTEFNPLRKQAPTPRPDYAIHQDGILCSILDAKYRDLWNKPLPREMLYQLVVYAISQNQKPRSSILYPTLDSNAKEARIDISDPILGKPLGQVCLRPVNLHRIEQLVSADTASIRRERVRYTESLALG